MLLITTHSISQLTKRMTEEVAKSQKGIDIRFIYVLGTLSFYGWHLFFSIHSLSLYASGSVFVCWYGESISFAECVFSIVLLCGISCDEMVSPISTVTHCGLEFCTKQPLVQTDIVCWMGALVYFILSILFYFLSFAHSNISLNFLYLSLYLKIT